MEPLISKVGQSRPCAGERWWMAPPVENHVKTVRHTVFLDSLTPFRYAHTDVELASFEDAWEPRPYRPGVGIVFGCCTTCTIKTTRRSLEFGIFPWYTHNRRAVILTLKWRPDTPIYTFHQVMLNLSPKEKETIIHFNQLCTHEMQLNWSKGRGSMVGNPNSTDGSTMPWGWGVPSLHIRDYKADHLCQLGLLIAPKLVGSTMYGRASVPVLIPLWSGSQQPYAQGVRSTTLAPVLLGPPTSCGMLWLQ